MKKWLALLLLCAPLWAQNTKSGSITGTTCFGIDTTNAGTVGISVQNSSSGSAWSGTIQPSASIGGDPAANIQVTPSTGGASQSTITANGVYYAAISGSTYVQVCGNTVTNTAAIKLFPAQYSKNFGGGGGSGSGTVSANNTAAGAVANYAAAGGSTTVGPTTLNYVAPTLTVSTATGGNGVLALSGNTSGTATFTAPAVAGTTSNGVTSSNAILVPSITNCTTPGLGFTGSTTTGLFAVSNILFVCANGAPGFTVNPTGYAPTNGHITMIQNAAPSIAAAGCGGAAASIPDNNGPGAFGVNVGTTPGSACTVTLPSAGTNYTCWATDITTQSTSVFLQKMTAETTTSVTITNFNTAGAATAFVASDILRVSCLSD